MAFEWDNAKARANALKHGVPFAEAQSVFGDSPRSFYDATHSEAETRFTVIGWSDRGRLLTVVITFYGDNIRIISARRATRREVNRYGEA